MKHAPATPPTNPPRVAVRRAAVAGVVAIAVLVRSLSHGHWVADAAYLGVLTAAGVAAWWGAAQARPGERLVPSLVAAGVSLAALGDVLWTVLDHLGVDTDVSVADVAWGSGYLALSVATWLVLSRNQASGRSHVDAVVDVLTVVVVSVVLIWGTSLQGLVTAPKMSPFAASVQTSYPIADAVLLGLLVRALVTRRSRRRLGTVFASGVSVWLAADVVYLCWPDAEAATVVTDALWMVGPVLMAWATWPSRTVVPDRPATHEPHVSVLQLLVAVGPLLVPPTLEVVADLRGEPDRPLQLFASMVVLVALALVRTARLLDSERRAHHELERTRDAALEASEAKSVFLANMGHEIRTPLTTVLAAAEMLEDTELDPGQHQLLLRVQRSGGLLRDLVERVLDYSRFAGGDVVLHPTAFDPAVLVADVVDAYAARARERGLDLTSYVDPAGPQVVTADLVRVFQVLTNLMDNAFKFTTHGGVRLEVRLVDGRADLVRFLVVDTGIGIRPEHQERIFDLFEQVDGSVTRSYGGSGLGLAICKQLASAMGGSVTVTSRDGEGSCFELRVPVAPTVPTVLSPERPAATARSASGRYSPSRHPTRSPSA